MTRQENKKYVREHFQDAQVYVKLESNEQGTDCESDVKVLVPLYKLVHNDEACSKLGINPYCINEGADRNAMYSISVEDAKSWGII